MAAPVVLLPSARRLINSLRDIGYDAPAAIADLVDNSIAAHARRVDIDFYFDGPASWVRIADDGDGMGASALDEAMRYGTQRTYDRNDLGRFGLGLKTASLSQCRLLTVASRRSPLRRRIQVRQWDLSRVARRNAWELLRLSTDEAGVEVVEPLADQPGTVVLWEDLDRLNAYRNPMGGRARNSLASAGADVRDHLAMVFHRFLAGEAVRTEPLTIAVNGQRVEAWDPYARTEVHTEVLEPQRLGMGPASDGLCVLVQPYVLPSQQRFSSAAAHAHAAGPNRWNRQQGFYFYRNDRLLQAGGWNRIRTFDEHTKLARIAVDIPPGTDELFGINVAKVRITIPSAIRSELAVIASGVAARASGTYRQHLASRRGNRSLTVAPGTASDSAAEIPSAATYTQLIRILNEELSDHPDVVARILSRLQLAWAGSDASSVRTTRPDSAHQPFVISRRSTSAGPSRAT